ncbi:SdiA-regulated domain-containing protein [Thorsellia anophelis]|uniref:Ig-like domain-containing protein n=1 Tax=Thorsellia anophelis DSM 18579 TaxID=1123402 RepID=A0A1H9ZHZ6_9GAMM|nr:SdiA-regulated domain-containing protein [Thorsellia anophelis]SES80946.1 Ig-like domain-containing protein [Thorsellia anophelis DSM 18579]
MKKFDKKLIVLILSSFLIAACDSNDSETTSTPEITTPNTQEIAVTSALISDEGGITKLAIEFNQPVVKGKAGSVTLTPAGLMKAQYAISPFAVSDTGVITIDIQDDAVEVDGNVFIIRSIELNPNTTYSISFTPDAILNLSGKPFKNLGNINQEIQPADETPKEIPNLSFVAKGNSFDLENYTKTGQYDLEIGTDSTNLLAAEVSAVTYNKDSKTLFVVGDSGTSIVQIGLDGKTIDSMPLPQFLSKHDNEGIAYIGNNEFVYTDERERVAHKVTYNPNANLVRRDLQELKIGTTVGNDGIEGVSYNPVDNHYYFVRETFGLFKTSLNFETKEISNGGPETVDSENLFDLNKLHLENQGRIKDIGDIYALGNILPEGSKDRNDLLVLSEASGALIKISPEGIKSSERYLELSPDPSQAPHAQLEGVTMDENLTLYITAENGDGVTGKSQLWVMTPTLGNESVGVDSHLYLSFENEIKAGTGMIEIKSESETIMLDVTNSSQVLIEDDTVKLNPPNSLMPDTKYTISYPKGTFIDSTTDMAMSSLLAEDSLGFKTTAETYQASILALYPNNSVANFPINGMVKITFNQTIRLGTGKIVLKNETDNSVIEINATDKSVTLDNSIITIDLSNTPLSPVTRYTLTVEPDFAFNRAGDEIIDPAPVSFLTAPMASESGEAFFQKGDIQFLSGITYGAPADGFSFMLLKVTPQGQSITISDRDTLAATNESFLTWTADKLYPVGTIIEITTDATTTNKGIISAPAGGVGKGETIFAFTGSELEALTKDNLIAALSLRSGVGKEIDQIIAQAFDANDPAYLKFAEANVKYNSSSCSLDPDTLKMSITDKANCWLIDDNDPSPFDHLYEE